MTELKNCPFCGGEAKIADTRSVNGDTEATVMCWTCGAEVSRWVPYFEDDTGPEMAKAIAAWNTRAEASSAEPVAWMYRRDGRNVILRERLHRDGVLQGVTGWTETPLYAHSPATPDTVTLDRALVDEVRNLLEDGGTTSVRMEYGMGWHNRRRATLNALWEALK